MDANRSLSGKASTYAASRILASGSFEGAPISNYLIVGQIPGNPYGIYRTFLLFDTSSIGTNTAIKKAVLSLFPCDDEINAYVDFVIQGNMPDYPHNPVVVGDYNYLNYQSSEIGGMITSGRSENRNGWNGPRIDMELNGNAISWINKIGITKFCLRAKKDVDNIASTSYYEAAFFNAAQAGVDLAPYLTIDYVPATTIPTLAGVKTITNIKSIII